MCAYFVFLGMAEKKNLQKIFDCFSDCETNGGINTDDPRFMYKVMSFNAFKRALFVIEIDDFIKKLPKNNPADVMVLPEDYYNALSKFAEGEYYKGFELVLEKNLPEGNFFLTSGENYTNSKTHYEKYK
tara:strand:+ start:264 stop:650 length:387 start_codon:yes stop_codon:yes gene_type:complete